MKKEIKREKVLSITEKDLKIETFKGGGPGGQHRNKTETGVRITHIESGATGKSTKLRSQLQNRSEAFKTMIESKTFQTWLKLRLAHIFSGESIEQKVEKAMVPKNLKLEIVDDSGKWKETKIDLRKEETNE